MTRDQNDTPSARHEDLARPYRLAIWWTTVVWLAVVAVFLGRVFLAATADHEMNIGETLIIAVASLLISFASMIPSLLGQRSTSRRSLGAQTEQGTGQSEPQRGQTGLLVVGMMIRLTGTVALFLTCRYQMATSTEMVAAMTIGWYVLLTFVDVLVLALELPKATGGTVESALSRMPANGQGFARD